MSKQHSYPSQNILNQQNLFEKTAQVEREIEKREFQASYDLSVKRKKESAALDSRLQKAANNYLSQTSILSADEIVRRLKKDVSLTANKIRETVSGRFQKSKNEIDNIKYGLDLSEDDQDLIDEWKRVDYSGLAIPVDEVFDKNEPRTFEECVEKIRNSQSKLIQLGFPSNYGNGRLGRNFFEIMRDIGESALGILGAVWEFLFGLLESVGCSWTIAIIVIVLSIYAGIVWRISTQFDFPFFSTLKWSAAIILALGVAISVVIGILNSDENEEQKRRNKRSNLRNGVAYYLILEQALELLPSLYQSKISTLQDELNDELVNAKEQEDKLLASVEKFEWRLNEVDRLYQDALRQVEFSRQSQMEGLRRESLIISKKILQHPWLAIAHWHDISLSPDGAAQAMIDISKDTRCSVKEIRIGQTIPPDSFPFREAFSTSIDFSKCGHVFIFSTQNTEQQATELLKSIAARVVFCSPVTSTKFAFIDARAAGVFAEFQLLPEKMGNHVYSMSDEIPELMRSFEVYQKQTQAKVGNGDLETFNQKAPVPEMYRFLLITGFPNYNRFSREAEDYLENIIESGTKVGIHVILKINLDPSKDYANGVQRFTPEFFFKHGAVLKPSVMNEQNWELCFNEQIFAFSADKAPDTELYNVLISKAREIVEKKSSPVVGFDKFPPDQIWIKSGRPMIDVPIGTVGTLPLRFKLGSDGVVNLIHALVAGGIGSGKSTLFHMLINMIALNYSPDEIELYLVDLKTVEFTPYADYNLPHVKVVAIESEPEFGLSVLQKLWVEHQRRARMGMRKFEEFEKKLPRIIAIFDEYQMLFDRSSSSADLARELFDKIARQSRSSGIHLVLGSQSIVNDIDSSTYDQFDTRILLKSSENLAAQMLGANNAHRHLDLKYAGAVILNENKGIGSSGTPVGQVTFISTEQIVYNLEQIKEKADRQGCVSNPIVFRGGQKTWFTNNRTAMQLYRLNEWLGHSNMKEVLGIKDWNSAEHPALVWLGDAVEIKPPTAAIFRRRHGANLLFVGIREEVIFNMFCSCLLSIPMFYKPDSIKFFLADLSLPETEWSELFSHFKEQFQVYQDAIQVHKKQDADKIIDEVYKILQQRQNGATAEASHPTVFLLLAGAHRIMRLKPSKGDFSFEISSTAAQLIEILKDGPVLGIHTILWVDNMNNFINSFERSTINYFDQRVALRLGSDDENIFFLDAIATNGLKDNRALFYDKYAEKKFEKFTPYSIPVSSKEQIKMFRAFAHFVNKRTNRKS